MKKDKKQKKEKKKTKDIDDEIKRAEEDMENLLKSLQELTGNEQIKVVRIKMPRPTYKSLIPNFIYHLSVNLLLMTGMRGFIPYFGYDKITDILFFGMYYTALEEAINFVFLRNFMPLIIETMGIANLLPMFLPLVIVGLIPVFVRVDDVFLFMLVMVSVVLLKALLTVYLKNTFGKGNKA